MLALLVLAYLLIAQIVKTAFYRMVSAGRSGT